MLWSNKMIYPSDNQIKHNEMSLCRIKLTDRKSYEASFTDPAGTLFIITLEPLGIRESSSYSEAHPIKTKSNYDTNKYIL